MLSKDAHVRRNKQQAGHVWQTADVRIRILRGGAGTSVLVCPVQVVDPTWVRVFLYVPKRVLADSWFGTAATI